MAEKLWGVYVRSLTVVFAIGIAGFTYLATVTAMGSDSILWFVWAGLSVPVWYFVVTFVHEFGHAVAAWSFNYKVHVWAVKPIEFNFDKRKFYLIPDDSQSEIAGYVACSPPWARVGTRYPEIIVSIAGPLATGLLGAGLLWLSQNLLVQDIQASFFRTYMRQENYRMALQLLSYTCFLDMLINLIPVRRANGACSDGLMIFKSLFKSRWTAESWMISRFTYEGDPVVSDFAWRDLRQVLSEPECYGDKFKSIMAAVAWIKTDPEAFVRASESITAEGGVQALKRSRHYAACRCLTGQYDASLLNLFEEECPEDSEAGYYFCKAVVWYAAEKYDVAIECVEAFRAHMASLPGGVPDDEALIFEAIESGRSFPRLNWDPIQAA